MKSPESVSDNKNKESGPEKIMRVVVNGVVETFKDMNEYRKWLQQQLEETNP